MFQIIAMATLLSLPQVARIVSQAPVCASMGYPIQGAETGPKQHSLIVQAVNNSQSNMDVLKTEISVNLAHLRKVDAFVLRTHMTRQEYHAMWANRCGSVTAQ